MTRFSILYLQDTVSKLLSSFFKEDKTRRELDKYCLDLSDFPKTACVLFLIPHNLTLLQ